MRLAVLSDVHGNAAALEAVLSDVAAFGVDRIWLLGDFVAFGPAPAAVLRRVLALANARFVQGNTDRYVLSDEPKWASFRWTRRHLSEDDQDFLRRLPTRQVEGDLLGVHASPRSDEEGIEPGTDDEGLRHMLAGVKQAVVFCGHTHLPLDRRLDRWRVVNVGSVGLPLDGDRRASYVLVDRDDEPRVEFRRVSYDVGRVIAELEQSDHPRRDWVVERLETARRPT
jgi:putative phosphoesterase